MFTDGNIILDLMYFQTKPHKNENTNHRLNKNTKFNEFDSYTLVI